MVFKNEDEKLRKRSKIDDADTFWDVGDITPPREKGGGTVISYDTSAFLVRESERENSPVTGEPISPPEPEEKDGFEYVPDNPLISKVCVGRWRKKYTFYERFSLDALRYFNETRPETSPVKYSSYMPSYIQMTPRQKDWYFYWRERARNKDFLQTDSSYILLYIYEIINLQQLIPPEKGIEMLCDIWEHYRTEYTKLDRYMAEWLCDYCLIHRLALPRERVAGFIDKIAETALLSQFYLDCRPEDAYACLLMEKVSSYRFMKSRYLTDDNKAVFSEYISRGFSYAVKRLAPSDGRFDGKSGRMAEIKRVRDAFSGALCSYRVKRRIEVQYYELYGVDDLCFIVTDMVKYCENRVRAALGIKARLVIKNLTEYQKNVIDEFFDRELPCREPERAGRKQSIDEDRYSERVRTFEVSFEKAREIEENSWQITERLVDIDETEDDLFEEPSDTEEQKTEVGKTSVESETLDVARSALKCIARGDNIGFTKLAEDFYMLPETMAECVNELCYEFLGDVGIEERDGGYVLIEDYKEEILQWLNS